MPRKSKSQDQRRRATRDYFRMKRAMASPREKELQRKVQREQKAARRAAETPEEAELRRARARKRAREIRKRRKRKQKQLFMEMNIQLQPELCADKLECCLKVEPECYDPDYAAPQSTSKEPPNVVYIKHEPQDEQDMVECCVKVEPECYVPDCVAPHNTDRVAPEVVYIKVEPQDEQEKGEDMCVSSLPEISNCHSVAPEESSTDAPSNASLQGDGTGVQDMVS